MSFLSKLAKKAKSVVKAPAKIGRVAFKAAKKVGRTAGKVGRASFRVAKKGAKVGLKVNPLVMQAKLAKRLISGKKSKKGAPKLKLAKPLKAKVLKFKKAATGGGGGPTEDEDLNPAGGGGGDDDEGGGDGGSYDEGGGDEGGDEGGGEDEGGDEGGGEDEGGGDESDSDPTADEVDTMSVPGEPDEDDGTMGGLGDYLEALADAGALGDGKDMLLSFGKDVGKFAAGKVLETAAKKIAGGGSKAIATLPPKPAGMALGTKIALGGGAVAVVILLASLSRRKAAA